MGGNDVQGGRCMRSQNQRSIQGKSMEGPHGGDHQ